MTNRELADAMRCLADAVENIDLPLTEADRPMFDGEFAIGAVAYLQFVIDLVTSSPKESWSKPELLVLLDDLARSDALPPGLHAMLKTCEGD